MLTVQVSLLFEILIDALFFLKETPDETIQLHLGGCSVF